jgi:O-methyltransferase domain
VPNHPCQLSPRHVPQQPLLIIEMVLPEGNAFHPGKMLDMTMLATTPGQERTEPEYRALLEKANFKLTRGIPTDSAVSIVEASPA